MRQFYKIKKLRSSEADRNKNLQFLLFFLFFNLLISLLKTAPTGLLTTYFLKNKIDHETIYPLAICSENHF